MATEEGMAEINGAVIDYLRKITTGLLGKGLLTVPKGIFAESNKTRLVILAELVAPSCGRINSVCLPKGERLN